MTGHPDDLAFPWAKRPADQIRILQSDIQQLAFARRLPVRDGRLVQVPHVVQFVAMCQVRPAAFFAGVVVLGIIDRPRRVEVTVGLLGGGDLVDYRVNVGFQLWIGVSSQTVGCPFDCLEHVRVVEVDTAETALLQAPGDGEVVNPTRFLAHPEHVPDSDTPVGFDARSPETAFQPDLRERYRTDRVVMLCPGSRWPIGCKRTDQEEEKAGVPGLRGEHR